MVLHGCQTCTGPLFQEPHLIYSRVSLTQCYADHFDGFFPYSARLSNGHFLGDDLLEAWTQADAELVSHKPGLKGLVCKLPVIIAITNKVQVLPTPVLSRQVIQQKMLAYDKQSCSHTTHM